MQIDTRPLSLEHQAIFDPLWKQLCLLNNLQFAEYSFANVFLFRKQHSYVFINSDPPQIQGKFQDGGLFFIPALPPEKLVTKNHYLPTEQSFFPIPDQWLAPFRDNHYQITSDRADSDYLFSRTKLQTMSGRALASRRNLIHQLESHYVLKAQNLDQFLIPEAQKLLERWQSEHDVPKEKTDYYPCLEALEHMKRFNLFGRMVYANDKPIGFTIGELLTPKTTLLHAAKFLKEFKGATAYLYRDFAQNVPSSVEWINLEQDLGLPSLRQAKLAFAPDLIAPKWRAKM